MCVARLAALHEGLSPVADGTELVKNDISCKIDVAKNDNPWYD